MTFIFVLRTLIEIIVAVAIIYSIAREDKALAFVNGIIGKINIAIKKSAKSRNCKKNSYYHTRKSTVSVKTGKAA